MPSEVSSPLHGPPSPLIPLPARWAMAEGYGASLLHHPELVSDMVKTTASRTGIPVSIKIRVKKDLR